MATLNDRIKERRLSLGLTLAQIAEFLNVKEATAQRYESGDIKNIKHETIFKLSKILHCEPSYLMGWSDELYSTQNNIETQTNFELSEHEKKIISAYRNSPSMQGAVDRLLNVNKESNCEIASDMCEVIKQADNIRLPTRQK